MLYLSAVLDRHEDPAYKLFRDFDKAVAYTDEKFREAVGDEGVIVDPSVPNTCWWEYEYGSDEAHVVPIEDVEVEEE